MPSQISAVPPPSSSAAGEGRGGEQKTKAADGGPLQKVLAARVRRADNGASIRHGAGICQLFQQVSAQHSDESGAGGSVAEVIPDARDGASAYFEYLEDAALDDVIETYELVLDRAAEARRG